MVRYRPELLLRAFLSLDPRRPLLGLPMSSVAESRLLMVNAARPVVPALLDHYLSGPPLSCCDLAVGISLELGGSAWNEHTSDHWWHLNGWFFAADQMRQPNAPPEVQTFVWDESYLTIRADGPDLILADGHAPRYTFAPIRVERDDFLTKLASAGRDLRELAAALRAEVASRGADLGQLATTFAPHEERPLAKSERERFGLIVRELASLDEALIARIQLPSIATSPEQP